MRRTALLGATALFFLLAGVACDDQPCDEFVDYMCDCHDGEAGWDCEELQRLYADADPDVQDACAIDLADQEDQDEADGHWCATGGDTGF